MRDEDFRKLSETIRRRGERPASEQRVEMVRRGAIDESGKVTLRRPEDRSSSGSAKTIIVPV